jgi:hypothetical protein
METPAGKNLDMIVRELESYGLVAVEKEKFENGDYLYYLHKYESYEHYKEVQIYHNKRKIDRIWADERTLDRVIDIVKMLAPKKEVHGICHGTRNGFEQKYLNDNSPGRTVIGTDISDSALDFSNTVVWDYHDENEAWLGKFNFCYSNSLDQAWHPQLALQNWLNQIREDGVVIIEHTLMHGPLGAGEMDPFGVHPLMFPYVIAEWFGHQVSLSFSKANKSNMPLEAWLFVIRKHVDKVVCLPTF